MRYKVTFATGFAAGYVLGARAGRERYESIKRYGRRMKENPAVQETAGLVQARATNAVGTVKRAVSDRMSGRSGGPDYGTPSYDSAGFDTATYETGGYEAAESGAADAPPTAGTAGYGYETGATDLTGEGGLSDLSEPELGSPEVSVVEVIEVSGLEGDSTVRPPSANGGQSL